VSDPLRLLRMRLSVPGLLRLGKARGVSGRSEDLGYLAHCELKELFGDAPGPFRLDEPSGRWLSLHAYTHRSKAKLVEHARSYADPVAIEAWDPDSMAEKELPAEWQSGRPVGFEVRCCPIVRLSKELRIPGADGEPEGSVTAGAEIDAFLARAWREPGPVDREVVYREWFLAELGRRGGIVRAGVRITAMKRTALTRRTHGGERKTHSSERPDVTFAGSGEIVDSAGLLSLLARGIGRHRAFGFGMVLLRPPSGSC
jgi:CRISPR system Cascade subunit CasE